MHANEYQKQAGRTLIESPDHTITDAQYMIIWNALGLAGEAGEVVDLIKKGICHQHGLDREKVLKELGDVLWYVAALCTKLDASMADVMELNIEKLRKRYGAEGYTAEQSRSRAE